MITKNHIKIDTITQYEFGESGLMVMGTNHAGKGKIYSLVKIPGIDRYWVSETRNYEAEQTNVFAVRDINSWTAMSLDHGDLTSIGGKTGIGYLSNLFTRFLVAAAIASIGALIVDHKVRQNKHRNQTEPDLKARDS